MMYILKSLERDVLSYFLVFLRLWREGIWWQVFKNPRGHKIIEWRSQNIWLDKKFTVAFDMKGSNFCHNLSQQHHC